MKKINILITSLFAIIVFGLVTASAETSQEADFTVSGDYWYTLLEDDTVQILSYNGKEKELVLTDELDGHKVSSIGPNAFENSLDLESVEIPLSVTTIQVNPFSRCKKLNYIRVSPEHSTFVSINGVLIRKQDSCLLSYPLGIKETSYTLPNEIQKIGIQAFASCKLKKIKIPDSVVEIGEEAFLSCNYIQAINLPESVQKIGAGAFNDCTVLLSMEIPEGVSDIGDNTFSNCSAMTSIVLPESIISIGNNAFFKCRKLKEITIPENVSSIGDMAFAGCSSLNDIAIPESVTTVGSNPFAACSALVKIKVSPDHPTLTTIDHVLFSKVDKRLVCYPASMTSEYYTVPNGIKIIDNEAFSHCEKLTEILVPDSVEYIGFDAFSKCNNLEDIRIFSRMIELDDQPSLYDNVKVLITVYKDSNAAQFCKDHKIDYSYFDANDWLLE